MWSAVKFFSKTSTILQLSIKNTANVLPSPILPARQTIQVAGLPLDALVEISCIAVKNLKNLKVAHMEKGSLQIHSENILPIIKKWLYSDRDIFVRELISNACDAIQKTRILRDQGEIEVNDQDFRIDVADR